MNIYKCNHCKNIIIKLKNNNIDPLCCNDKMELLVVNENDASVEKHVPICLEEDNKLKVVVGEVEHPMNNDHYIEWILLERNDGFDIYYLKPNDKPVAYFEKTEWKNIYTYCNLHSLWKNSK